VIDIVIFKLLKHLKKKLRRKLKWISLGIIVVIALSFILNWNGSDESQTVFKPANPYDQIYELNQSVLGKLEQSKQTVNVFMQKKYVCGEELQQIGNLSPQDVTKLSKVHPDWEVAIQDNGHVYLTQYIQDLSATCREAAYFGVDESGVLSLFDGLPQQNKVIQSFFQLNVQFLKSSLPPETVDQLYVGIRVSDLEEYNSVLSTFAEYAISGMDQAATNPNTELK
jgi:forespore regulator of the sigma-K checkpoint